MSQPATETPPAAVNAARGNAGGGNIFTRKLGPLPMWVWLLIGVAAIAGYVLFTRRGSGSSASGAAGGTTSAAQIPQFVNQTYTTVQPPVAPVPAPATGGGPPVGIKTLTVGRAMTLKEFAKEHHWTETTLAAVEKLNNLKPGAKLKKGQKIKRPWAPQQPGQPTDTG